MEGRARPSRGEAAMRRLARHHGETAETAGRTLRELGEMQLAAARTIAIRSVKIAAATRDPSLLADPELTTMVTEKIEAAVLVASAALGQLGAPAAHTARWLNDQALLWARSLGRLGLDPSPESVCLAWQRLAEGTALAHAAYGAALLGSMAELGKAALAPVHKATTANARRLYG